MRKVQWPVKEKLGVNTNLWDDSIDWKIVVTNIAYSKVKKVSRIDNFANIFNIGAT